jgi:hypothetical protein
LFSHAARTEEHLWIGNDGVTTNLHYDGYDGILCVLQGKKRVSLIPRTRLMEAYPNFPLLSESAVCIWKQFALFNTQCFVQLGNINKPDILEKFPEAAVAFKEKIEIDLNAGEALFIPGFDWHFVVSSGVGNWNRRSQHCWVFELKILLSGIAINIWGSLEETTVFKEHVTRGLNNCQASLLYYFSNLPPKHLDYRLNTLEHLFL